VNIILSGENASTTSSLDLLLCLSGEEPGLDDDGLFGQLALAKHLEESCARHINDRRLLGIAFVGNTGLLAHQGPQLVQVDRRAVLVWCVGVDMEIPHTHLKGT